MAKGTIAYRSAKVKDLFSCETGTYTDSKLLKQANLLLQYGLRGYSIIFGTAIYQPISVRDGVIKDVIYESIETDGSSTISFSSCCNVSISDTSITVTFNEL